MNPLSLHDRMAEINFVTRYVITERCRDTPGLRKLAYPQQGRFTFATAEEAQFAITAIMENNNRADLENLLGLPLEVYPCKCYPGHFDPAQSIFEEVTNGTTVTQR